MFWTSQGKNFVALYLIRYSKSLYWFIILINRNRRMYYTQFNKTTIKNGNNEFIAYIGVLLLLMI